MRVCSRKNLGGQDKNDRFSFGYANFEVCCEICRLGRLVDVLIPYVKSLGEGLLWWSSG